MKPDCANSKDWDTTQNVFIEGDNLEVLKTLQRHYHNKIKVIYIDPPYNTGKDFVYPDNYKEGLETYLEWTRQVNEDGKKISSNSETEGRYHSNWLNMMYPRLKLARNLLTEDGVILISIDDNEVANLRRLCDEVLGEGNFIDCIVWKKRYGGGPKEKHLVSVHEYVLIYARNINFIPTLGVPTSEEQVNQYYKLTDEHHEERGPYRLHPLEAVKSLDARPNLVYDIPAPDGSLVSPKRQWAWSKERTMQSIEENRLEFVRDKNGEWSIHTKQYLYDESGDIRKTKAQSLIDNIYTQHGTNEILALMGNARVFSFPKPSEFIKRLLVMADRDDDAIVLDFFAGSSSSAHAVMQLNAEDGGKRRFIMVQLPEPTPEDSEARKAGFKTISEISRKRIELAGTKIKREMGEQAHHIDTGFRAYKLADTNFAKWHVTSDIDPSKLQKHLEGFRDSSNNNATQDDLLTEILLKIGFPLTACINDVIVEDLPVKRVSSNPDNFLLAYLDERTKPTLEQLRALVDMQPVKLIVLEDAFQGDDELKTNLAQYAKSKDLQLWTA